MSRDYDGASRLTALRNLKADRAVLSIFTYSYDAVGNRTQVEEANGDVVSWSYDEIGQLTRERRSGANAYDTTYTYDAVGNRLTKEESGVVTTYSYDAANQLSYFEDNGGLTTFSYDANGNTTLELRPNSDRVTYTWDIENRQTKVELPANVVNTITLDGDGKRCSIEDSAGLRKLIWDGENILAELDNAAATLAAYTLAPEAYGALISQRRSGATSFHHFDALGSTNKLTDSNAASLVEYLYRAFGQQSVLSGSSANRFTWVGKLGYYRQNDAGDYWVRERIFQVRIGIWLSRAGMDEQLAGEYPYSYSMNNPINYIDPAGAIYLPLSVAPPPVRPRPQITRPLPPNRPTPPPSDLPPGRMPSPSPGTGVGIGLGEIAIIGMGCVALGDLINRGLNPGYSGPFTGIGDIIGDIMFPPNPGDPDPPDECVKGVKNCRKAVAKGIPLMDRLFWYERCRECYNDCAMKGKWPKIHGCDYWNWGSYL